MASELSPSGSRREKAESSPLEGWLDAHGIKAVLFDLDDTLLDTFAWEMAHEDQYLNEVNHRLPAISLDVLTPMFRTAHTEGMKKHSVHRDRFTATVDYISESQGEEVGKAFKAALPVLFHIYEGAPELLPGALDVLDQFTKTGRKLGLVTHAEADFTHQKLSMRNLRSYFDVVRVADARGAKTLEDWKAAIEVLGIKPEEALVIGDNISGDILAAKKAGVTYTAVLPSPWDIHREGHIPEGAIQAITIAEVIPTLLHTR